MKLTLSAASVLFAAVQLLAHATAPLPFKRIYIVIPTPVKISLTGEEVEIDGFNIEGNLPQYAREAGGVLFAGKMPAEFHYDTTLGQQAYSLSACREKVIVAAGDEAGAIYAVQTLRQLVTKHKAGRYSLALGEVYDKPHFSIRGINWNTFVEARGWSMDDGRGIEDFKRRFIAGLDTMSFLKLNAVIIDGIGWNPERFPGYGMLMRSLSHEARRRGIRIGYTGYSEGYGSMWLDSDGPKFENRKSGHKYPCFGLTGSPQRECGTCLSNQKLMEAKKENLRAFVAATEPGFLYVHGADIFTRSKMEVAWSNRCTDCREKWPSDDTCATNGAAGSFAYLYDELKDAVSSVRNPETGYDAARDLMFLAVGPNYTDYRESDEEWLYHLNYFRSLSSVLRNNDIALMLREQYSGDDGIPRMRKMKEAVGSNARLAVIEFCAGDGYLNSTPATGEMALTRFFDGCDIVIAAGGNAFGEPRQALWAEYEWNPFGSAYTWNATPASCNQTCTLYDDLSDGRVLPEPIFRERDGLLAVVCRKLYGDKAGDMVSSFLPPQQLGIPARKATVAVILPLASERLPGCYFSRFRFLRGKRELRWREDLDDWDIYVIRAEIACERASVAKTRAAAIGFRRAADVCEARRDSLLRMAAACDIGAELGDLTVLWLDLLLRRHVCRTDDGRLADFTFDLRRLEAEARRQVCRFEGELKKMIDPSGGWARDALMSAKYLLREAENIRTTLETGKFTPHPMPSWW